MLDTRDDIRSDAGHTGDLDLTDRSRRRAGRAAAAGGVLVLAGDAYHLFVLHDRPTQLATAGYRLHGLALMAGLLLFAIAAPALARTRGRLARVALPALLVGTALVVGDIWAETVVVPGVVAPQPGLTDEFPTGYHLGLVIAAYAVFAIGWLLYAVAALRDAWCSKGVAILLVVGSVLAFLPFGGSYVLHGVALLLLGLGAARSR